MSPLLFNIYIDELTSLSDANHNVFIIAYADDILLLTPSVTVLQNIFHQCKLELKYLDMAEKENTLHLNRP